MNGVRQSLSLARSLARPRVRRVPSPSRRVASARSHEIPRTKVLFLEVQRRETGFLAALTIVQVVIIQAQHRGRVRYERVAVRVPTLGGRRLAAEQGRHATHKGGLPAPGIRGETDDDGSVASGAGDDARARRATRRRRLFGHDGRGARGGGECELRGHGARRTNEGVRKGASVRKVFERVCATDVDAL